MAMPPRPRSRVRAPSHPDPEATEPRRFARCPVEVVDPALVRPVDQPLLLADAPKLRSYTGREPRYTIEQTLADMLASWSDRLSAAA